jgi:hypothetical protein
MIFRTAAEFPERPNCEYEMRGGECEKISNYLKGARLCRGMSICGRLFFAFDSFQFALLSLNFTLCFMNDAALNHKVKYVSRTEVSLPLLIFRAFFPLPQGICFLIILRLCKALGEGIYAAAKTAMALESISCDDVF